MAQVSKWQILTGAIAVGLAASTTLAANPATQPSTQPSQQDLINQVQQLRAEVSQLRSQTQQNQTDTNAVVQQQILNDADHNTTLFDSQGGLTSGYFNRRFVIQSDDGNFVLRPWIHVQIRQSTAYRRDGLNPSTDDVQNGFELRRARLGFDGNLFTPDFTYFINWATYRENSTGTVKNSSGATVGTVSLLNGGLPVLEEAWVKGRIPDTDFFMKAGQLHDPLDHEAIVGSKYRAPEASLTGDIFANTDTFTQGATVIYDPKSVFRFEGGLTDGIRAANTNFEDAPINGIEYRWGVAARGELKVMGDWHDYDQLTSLNDKDSLLVFGLGGDYSEGAGFNTLSVTPDVQFACPDGLFLYGSYFARYTNHNPGIPNGAPVSTSFGTPATPGQDTYEWSGLAYASYLIDQKWEPFARYEYLDLKGTPTGSKNFISEISGGLNYYFFGHNAKLTLQCMWLPNGIPVNDDSSDVLISNDKQEVVFISQFQLLL